MILGIMISCLMESSEWVWPLVGVVNVVVTI